MRVLLTAVALSTVLALPASVFAAGGRQDPYGSLFLAQLNGSASLQPPAQVLQFVPRVAPPSASAQTITCGMTVVQGDSQIDAALVHRSPTSAPKPLITVVQPQICKH